MTLNDLSAEEREMVFNFSGVSRKEVDVFTDDVYWLRRLDKIATAYKVTSIGAKHYKITVSDFIKLFNLKEQKNAKSKETRKSSRFTTINKDDSSIEE